MSNVMASGRDKPVLNRELNKTYVTRAKQIEALKRVILMQIEKYSEEEFYFPLDGEFQFLPEGKLYAWELAEVQKVFSEWNVRQGDSEGFYLRFTRKEEDSDGNQKQGSVGVRNQVLH